MRLNLVEIIKRNVCDIFNIDEVNNYIFNLNLKNNSKRMYLFQYKKFLENKNLDSKKILKINQEFIPSKNYLTFEEIKKVKNCLEKIDEKFIFNAFLDTGARINEFTTIDWRNIVSDKIIIKTLKAKSKFRTIFIFKETMYYLENLKKINFNFDTFKSENKIRYMLRKISQKANLNILITPHVLRRTKGNLLRLNGAALEDIADILGHENLEITRKYYAKLNDEYLKSISKLSNLETITALNLVNLRKENNFLKKKIIFLENKIKNLES